MATKEGWNWLSNSPKRHFFDADGRSLCGGWLIMTDNADALLDVDDSPKNCKACRTKLEKRNLKQEQLPRGT